MTSSTQRMRTTGLMLAGALALAAPVAAADGVPTTFQGQPVHEVPLPLPDGKTIVLHATDGGFIPERSEHLEFIEAGGYARPELWSEAGRRWIEESRAEAPKYWSRSAEGWMTRVMDRVGPVEPDHPVCHVCYHEAEAFTRWVGKRLPSEIEWEAAASWDPDASRQLRYPWGDEPPSRELANLDQLGFGTAAVAAFPRNRSPIGCCGMIGDVWEWTSSDFGAWPGFAAFPYQEYSEVFFGNEYKVLRGGSWATRPGAMRNTFRNWDYPIRRQIFSGFRCARDA